MKVLLLISWLINGTMISEQWEYPSMQACIHDIATVNPQGAHMIMCTQTRRRIR